MRYRFVAEHHQEFPVKMMCLILDVSESGYYAWKKRAPSQRGVRDAVLSERIAQAYQSNRQVYGSPRIHAVLRSQGEACGRKQVARLMRQAGLSARRRRHRSRTTDSQHDQPVADNVLARDFTASAPNEKWLTDITGVWTAEGWLYLAVVLDVFSRIVVGWAMDSQRDEALVAHALEMALGRRQPSPGLLHHSDRGSQYTSRDYRARLAQADITVSMSRKGDCYDNAMMESFFSSFKAECIEGRTYQSCSQARQAIFEYLETFYNRQRLHSSLEYQSPAQFEQQNT